MGGALARAGRNAIGAKAVTSAGRTSTAISGASVTSAAPRGPREWGSWYWSARRPQHSPEKGEWAARGPRATLNAGGSRRDSRERPAFQGPRGSETRRESPAAACLPDVNRARTRVPLPVYPYARSRFLSVPGPAPRGASAHTLRVTSEQQGQVTGGPGGHPRQMAAGTFRPHNTLTDRSQVNHGHKADRAGAAQCAPPLPSTGGVA